MILAIDIGNTDIVFAIHKNKDWIFKWRTPSDRNQTSESYSFGLANELLEKGIVVDEIEGVVLCSVVPELTPVIQELSEKLFGESPLTIDSSIYPGLPVSTQNPEEIGTDLMANALAAYHRFKTACIVVDFGTALTFTSLNDKGEIQGVAIAPGLKTAMRTLAGNTAQLPEIPLELPDSVLGKDTIHAMQAGILSGYVGLVNHLLNETQKALGGKCKIIATGGLSFVLKPLHHRFDAIDVMLTLEGIRLIWQYR